MKRESQQKKPAPQNNQRTNDRPYMFEGDGCLACDGYLVLTEGYSQAKQKSYHYLTCSNKESGCKFTAWIDRQQKEKAS